MKPLLALLILFLTVAHGATPTNTDFPLGPIGGTFRIATGDNFARVSGLDAGGIGEVSGLRVGDFIYGSDGISFENTGSDFQGVTRQIGWAIGQAQATDGILSLNVLRSGVGHTTVDINLGTAGGFSPAYPLNSPTFAAVAEHSLDQLNSRLSSSSNLGYPTAFAGLALLASPHWNETTGAHPYRNGINTIYTYTKDQIERAQYSPVEEKFFDGSDNPHYNPTNVIGLENWYIGAGTMFLAEYYSKTLQDPPTQQNIDDLALLQMAAEKCANRIQWWRQPQTRPAQQFYTTLRPGIVGHGNVVGDYMHYNWGGGINMVGAHLSGGLAMAKSAGVDMTVRPIDGRYFGYDPLLFDGDPSNDPAGQSLPAGLNYDHASNTVQVQTGVDAMGEPIFQALQFIPDAASHPDIPNVASFATQQPTLDDKLNIIWDFYKRSQSTSTGHVNYLIGSGLLSDSGGRTPGALFTTHQMQKSGAFTGTDLTRYNLLKSYHTNEYNRHLNAHATNIQGPVFYALAASAFDTRERQHFYDNWRFFYELSRNADNSTSFFRGRAYGGSGESAHADEIYFALNHGVATGGLNLADGYDTTDKRLVDFKKVKHTSWTSISRRNIDTKGSSITLDLEVTDGAGAPVTGYSASWSTSSAATFSSTTSLDTTINFPHPGFFDVELTVTDGSITTVEPLRIFALSSVDETLYTPGIANYRVYQNITGESLSDLYASPKWPDSPDREFSRSLLQGSWGADNFGSTLTTTIVPVETGTYRFYLASDDDGSLLFNANGTDPTGAVEIASVSGNTLSEEWNKYPSQESVELTLTAGQHYYLEARMKEGTGGQVLEVGWTTPSNSTIEIVGSGYIAAPKDPPAAVAITTQPIDISAQLGDTITLTAEVTGPEPRLFHWTKDGERYGAISTSPTLEIPNGSAYLEGNWQLTYTSGDSVVVSDIVSVSFTDVGQIINGGLWQEVYNGISGNPLDGLLNAAKYPNSPDSSGPITTSYTGSLGNSYGQRWTGWVIPSETARYRFYGAADDQIVINLSESEYACHATEIFCSTSYTGQRNYDQRSPSAWVPLTAGQRYFIEVLHKEGGGGDHSAITWQKEGDPTPTDGSGGIPAANLQYRSGGADPDQACPPLARADTVTAVGGQLIEIPVLANDFVKSPATLSISSVSTSMTGTATISADGSAIRYFSPAGTIGTHTLTYQITSSTGESATGLVTVNLIDLSSGLRLHYDFENAAQDTSGNNYHGTLASGITTASDPTRGQVIVVDSNSDVVHAEADVFNALTTAGTISYWAKATQFTGNGVDYLKAFDGDGHRIVRWHYPWVTQAIMDWGDGIAGSSYDRTLKFSGVDRNGLLNRWNHIVLTKDSITGEQNIYSDGQLLASKNNARRTIGSATSFTFGGSHFRGQLDELCVYDRALTAAEITALYQKGTVPAVTLTASPEMIAEDGGTAITYVLTRTGDTSDPLIINLTINGTATNGTDYQTISSIVTIAAGQTTATFAATPIDDSIVENTESIAVTINPSPNYLISSSDPVASLTSDDRPDRSMAELNINKSTNTVSMRLSISGEATEAIPQWSTSLHSTDWHDMSAQPVRLSGEMHTMSLPAAAQGQDNLFFRWKVE